MTTISSASRRNIRPRQRQSQYSGFRLCLGVCLVLLLALLWNKINNDNDPSTNDGQLDSNEEPSETFNTNMTVDEDSSEETAEPTPEPFRVLFFDADKAVNSDEHRSVGYLLEGLLAAQLLGLEFERTVCVQWSRFWQAFDYVYPEQEELCQRAMQHNVSGTITVWRDEPFVDECDIFDTLNDATLYPILLFHGNRYPGEWTTEIPSNLFARYYKPKAVLQEALPKVKPKKVIHLRGELDDEMLYYLGELLHGGNNYLVTNELKYADRFKDCCGWSYDEAWGLDKRILPSSETDESDEEQTLKLWLDWYILLQASHVYQTPNSVFSESALLWNYALVSGYQLNGLTQMTTNINGKTEAVKVLKMDEDHKNRKSVPSLLTRHGKNLLRHCRNTEGGNVRKGALRRFFNKGKN